MATSVSNFHVDGEAQHRGNHEAKGSQARAIQNSAAAVFWRNWKVWPMMLVAVVLIWIFSWLYFGAAWGLEERTGNLHVAVLNCDRGYPSAALPQVQAAGLPSSPLATSLLSTSIWNTSSTAAGALHWHNLTCVNGHVQDSAQGLGLTAPYGCDASFESACSNDLMHQILHDDKDWAALFVPGNFSSNFVTAFGSSGGAAPVYSQMTLDYIFAQGRGFSVVATITGVMNLLVTQLSQNLGYRVAAANTQSTVAPNFYIQPIRLLNFNLAPVHTSGQNLSSYLLCVLLWLGATFIVASMFPFGARTEEVVVANILEKGVSAHKRKQGVVLVLLKGAIAYLFTLLLSTLLLVTIVVEGAVAQNPGASAQFNGHNVGYAIAFAWYLSFSFIAFDAILINLVGPTIFSTLSAFILIIQLTSSGGIIAHELQQPWYRIGVALPFYYGTKGFRTIFYGSGQGRMWLNWLVLTGWNVGCLPVAFLITTTHARRRVMAAVKLGQDGKHKDIEDQQQDSLSGLGNVALMGA